MTDTPPGSVSRRSFARSAGLLGLGAAAAGSTGPALAGAAGPESLTGPYLDLSTREGALAALVRTKGGAAASTYGWFDGGVMAVAPGGRMRSLCGFRGVSLSRTAPLERRFGWRVDHREAGYFYDRATGAVLHALDNEITGRRVQVEHVEAHLTDAVFDLDSRAVAWSADAGRLSAEEPAHALRHVALTSFAEAGDGATAIQTTMVAACLKDMQRAGDTVASTGSWARVTAWPAWLGMGETPGHCLIHCRFAMGLPDAGWLPGGVAADFNALKPGFAKSI